MNTNFRRALGFAVIALVGSAVLAAPLAQATGFERPGLEAVFSRAVGVAITGGAMLLIVETPVLFVLRWLTAGRVPIPRPAWALIAATVAIAPVVGMNVPGGSLSVKIMETLDASLSQPLIAVSEWLPLIVGGGVFGWYLFCPHRRSPPTAG
jgi:hypothetical protein